MHSRWSVLIQPRVVCITTMVFVCLVAIAEMVPTVRSPNGEENVTFRNQQQDSKFLDAMQQRILADLGLTRVPDVSNANISPEKMEAMLQLYKRSIEEEDDEEEDDEGIFGNGNKHFVERIYSFAAKGSSESRRIRFENGSTHQQILFPMDLSSQLNKSKSLKSAKLKVSGFRTGSNPKVFIHKVTTNSQSSIASLDLVMSLPVQSNSSYLINVEISDYIRKWTDELQSSHLVLAIELQNCSVAVRDTTVATNQDLAILDILVSESPNRVKRSNPIPYDFNNITTYDCTQGFRTKKCCRRALKLSFDDLGWDWIIRPKKFETFYCKGRCKSGGKTFANSHALMQSIIHSKYHKVPNACCAPKKFKTMTMLHYDDSSNVVMTKQKGMIVQECACT